MLNGLLGGDRHDQTYDKRLFESYASMEKKKGESGLKDRMRDE